MDNFGLGVIPLKSQDGPKIVEVIGPDNVTASIGTIEYFEGTALLLFSLGVVVLVALDDRDAIEPIRQIARRRVWNSLVNFECAPMETFGFGEPPLERE